MLTIEVRDQVQRPLAQFAIFPMPAVMAMPHELFANFQRIAQATGERYFFLVSSDEIRGWKIGQDFSHQPSFKRGTTDVLGRYASHPAAVTGARENYLAELVQAWLADLASGWKSHGPAPGAQELTIMGFLDAFRAAMAAGAAPL